MGAGGAIKVTSDAAGGAAGAIVLCGRVPGREGDARADGGDARAATTANDGDGVDEGEGGVGGGAPAIPCPAGCGGRLVDAPVAEAGDPETYNAWAAAAAEALLGVGPVGRGDAGGGTKSGHPGTVGTRRRRRLPGARTRRAASP